MNSILYIDSKIHGAIDQLIKHFDDGVFDKANNFVLFKEYKTSRKYYESMLKKHGIRYKMFTSFASIDLSGIKVIFYLFNAQSNCRMVAFRQVKHVFVTHGESHKTASVKPIIRIYDYVVCAGPVSLDRYLQARVFNEHDIQTGRLLTMGNTFIGQAEYESVDLPDNAFVLYAPTWEGGIETENFSSVEPMLHSFRYIIAFCKYYKIDRVILQPHPNLGHRDKAYLSFFEKGVKLLLRHQLSVKIRGANRVFSLVFKMESFITKRFCFIDHKIKLPVYRAFVDVSAMEAQLVSKEIRTNVFFTNTINVMPQTPLLSKYYDKVGIHHPYQTTDQFSYDTSFIRDIKSYYFSYFLSEIEEIEISKRVDFFLKFIIDK